MRAQESIWFHIGQHSQVGMYIVPLQATPLICIFSAPNRMRLSLIPSAANAAARFRPSSFLPSSSGNLKELELESCTLASPSPPPQLVRAAACFCVHVYGQVSQTNRKPSVKYSQL